MELENIYNLVINNGGLTLTKELENADFKSGFIVSKKATESTFDIQDKKAIFKTIKEYQARLKNNEYLGFWLDNGIFYIDISKHYESKQKAIKTGIINKQVAIFDIVNNKSIYLTKKAYIIYKYNKLNNDLEYIKEYYNINDIIKDYNLENKKSIYNYIVENIDNLDSYYNLLKNNYIIKIDNILINEF